MWKKCIYAIVLVVVEADFITDNPHFYKKVCPEGMESGKRDGGKSGIVFPKNSEMVRFRIL